MQACQPHFSPLIVHYMNSEFAIIIFSDLNYHVQYYCVFQLKFVIVSRSLAIIFSLHKLFIEIIINKEKSFD